MPPCVSGTTFEWPNVVFNSPDAAGNAVAAALQAATCTFTVAPTEPPTTPAPPAAPGAPRDIRLTPGDGFIDMAWSPPAEGADAITDYRARCTSDDGTIESAEGTSAEPGARVEGWSRAANTAAKWRRSPLGVTVSGSPREQRARSGSRLRLPSEVEAFPGAINIDVEPANRRRGVSLRMLVGWGHHVGRVDRCHIGEHERSDPRPGKRDRIRLPGVRRERNRRQRRLRTVGCRPAMQRPARLQPAALPIVVGTVSLLSIGILLALFGIYREG